MEKLQLIRQEIERQLERYDPDYTNAGKELKELLPFIDSRPSWEDECCECDLRTRFAFYTYKDDPGILYLSNLFVEESSRKQGLGAQILRSAEKVASTIEATSIRLKVRQNSPENDWYRAHGYRYLTLEDGYDWLEKHI